MLLTLIAGLGTFGAVAGIALKVFGLGRTLQGVSTAGKAAGGLLSRLPAKVWYVLIVIAAAWAAFHFGGNWYRSQIAAAEKRGSDAAYAAVEEQTLAIRDKANSITAGISNVLRKQSDEDLRRIDRSANAQLLRGPGAAICADASGLAAAARGYDEARGTGDAPLDRVSYPAWESLIAMPFVGTIEFARLCDANRSEVLKWREGDAKQREAWTKLQAQGAAR